MTRHGPQGLAETGPSRTGTTNAAAWWRRLSAVDGDLLRTRTLEDIGVIACRAAARRFRYRRAALFLHGVRNRWVQGLDGYAVDAEAIRAIREDVHVLPIFREALRSAQPAFAGDVDGSGALPSRYTKQFGLRSLLVVPLLDGREPVGYLLLDQAGASFSLPPSSRAPLRVLGLHLGWALQRAMRQRPEEPPLTPRQEEILRAVAQGLSNREIAARLHLSPLTVREYLSDLYRTLGVRNRVEAAARAWSRGLGSV